MTFLSIDENLRNRQAEQKQLHIFQILAAVDLISLTENPSLSTGKNI